MYILSEENTNRHGKERGYQKTSLAVQKANYAVKMYKNVGFEIIDENEEEYKYLVGEPTEPQFMMPILPEGEYRFACVDGICPYYGERIAEKTVRVAPQSAAILYLD